MGLLTPGYWPSTYWPKDYWADDYWPIYGGVVGTPSCRTVIIPLEDRTSNILSEDRTVIIPLENRTVTVTCQ